MEQIKFNIQDDHRIYVKGYILDQYPNTHQTHYPTVVIVPGGGFKAIPEAEAERLCLAYANKGYNAFYVRYHLLSEVDEPLMPTPLVDVAYAVKTLREHQEDYHMSGDITLVGFSIGGEIVSQYNGRYNEDWLLKEVDATAEQLRPNRIVLGYPVTSFEKGFPQSQEAALKMAPSIEEANSSRYVGPHCAPVFLWTTWDDNVVPSMNALHYATALREKDVPCELHIFDHGHHGLGLATKQTTLDEDPHVAMWFPLCIDWMNRNA